MREREKENARQRRMAHVTRVAYMGKYEMANRDILATRINF